MERPGGGGGGPSDAPSAKEASPGPGPVSLKADLESLILEAHQPHTIRVALAGKPLEVLWMKNGKEIRASDAAELREGPDGEFALELKDPLPEDSGAYVFEARGTDGTKAQSTATVLVVGTSSPSALSPCLVPCLGVGTVVTLQPPTSPRPLPSSACPSLPRSPPARTPSSFSKSKTPPASRVCTHHPPIHPSLSPLYIHRA